MSEILKTSPQSRVIRFTVNRMRAYPLSCICLLRLARRSPMSAWEV